jgi:hypothetical protein
MARETQTFTANTSWTVPEGASLLTVLVVGAGGGGGYNGGGGGGGGNAVLNTNYSVTPGQIISVTVGLGGTGGIVAPPTNATAGGSSAFGAVTATGGTQGNNNDGSGGSSGGFAGGAGNVSFGGGGGAGAGGTGFSAVTDGNGGVGYFYEGNFYGGGGGGGCETFSGATTTLVIGGESGLGGGGDGGSINEVGFPGTPNTGGGGGGGGHSGTLTTYGTAGPFPTYTTALQTSPAKNGGGGGSGLVVIWYDTAEYQLTQSGGPGTTEGGSFSVTLSTRNVPNGTVFPYTITGTVSASDFSPATLTGSFTISSVDGGKTGSSTVTLTMVSESITEGNETLTLTLNTVDASLTFDVGDFSKTPFTRSTDSAGYLVAGRSYTIATVGTTVWTALGAASNTIGVTFTATASGIVDATNLVVSRSYTILTAGDTIWTVFGAANNNVGTTFIATGPGTGTGTAIQGNGTALGIWIQKTIQVSDYNNIRNKVASVLGTGSVDYGYGQNVQSSAVSVESRVTVNDYANLRYDLINAWTHQFGSAPALFSASASDTVRANSLDAPYTQYDSYADVLVANRFRVHSSQAITVVKSNKSTIWPNATYGTTWASLVSSEISVTFTTAGKARGFFNSGGEIRFTSSRTGGTTVGSIASQNNAWSTLLSSISTVGFGGQKPDSGLEPNDGLNYYRLSDTYQTWINISATTPYAANSYKISAKTVGVADNSSGTATSLRFLVEWVDNHPGGLNPDGVDGTLNLAVSSLESSGVLQPSGAGTFVVESPTITATDIIP